MPPGRQEAGAPLAVHATAVVVRDAGILIRGASGHGKSRLALALIDLGRGRDVHARLVGDDRVLVQAANGRLIVEPHPAILGKIEHRGIGILTVPYQAAAIVRLVVDIVAPKFECDIPPRIPTPEAFKTIVCGVILRRMTLHSGIPSGEAAADVLNWSRGEWITA